MREAILPAHIEFASFTDLFRYLNSLEGTYNIVIDEYPYLKAINKPETVDSVFQSVIDNIFLLTFRQNNDITNPCPTVCKFPKEIFRYKTMRM